MATRPKSNLAQIILAFCAIITLGFTVYSFFFSKDELTDEAILIESNSTQNETVNYLEFKISPEMLNNSLSESKRGLLFTSNNVKLDRSVFTGLNCELKSKSIYSSKFFIRFNFAGNRDLIDNYFVWLINSNNKIVQSFAPHKIINGINQIDFEGRLPSGHYTIEIGCKNPKRKEYYYNKCEIKI